MLWLRKGVVHLLAVILLVSLLGIAVSASLNATFSKPDKLKGWLEQSGLYDQVIPSALDKAQTDATDNGSDGSVSFDDDVVGQAATQVFSPDVVRKSVNSFIDGNYNWLQGKADKPDFVVDLTAQKDSFADKVGQQVLNHLNSLHVCSDAELAQLQLPVNPLNVGCRPASLNAQSEADRVANDLRTGDFLQQPVLNATTINQDKDKPSEPYFQKLSYLPKLYSLAQILPLILALIAVLTALGVIFIAPTRRRGLRRTGIIFTLSGILLLAVKFLSNYGVDKAREQLTSQAFSKQLDKPYGDLLHDIVGNLVKYDLLFGLVFLVIGLGLIGYLIATREGAGRPGKAAKAEAKPSEPKLPAPELEDRPVAPEPPKPAPRPVSVAGGSDIAGRLRATPGGPRATAPPFKGPPRRKPPKLIQ